MENKNEETTEKLNVLIDIAEDGKEGYENADKNVKDEDIESSFLLFAEERSVYASQLREIVLQLKGEAGENGGDTKGTLHRVWIDLKSIFTGGDTEAIINACITGEEAAVKEYKLVLNDPLIPDRFKPLIGKQLDGIERALTSIQLHVHQ